MWAVRRDNARTPGQQTPSCSRLYKTDTGTWSVSLSVGHDCSVLFCSSAVLDLRVGHPTDVLSPFITVLCHSDWLFHGESCPRLDVVHPGRAWSSSPACTCIISFSRQLPCFLMVWPKYASFLALTVSNSSLFTPALLRIRYQQTSRMSLLLTAWRTDGRTDGRTHRRLPHNIRAASKIHGQSNLAKGCIAAQRLIPHAHYIYFCLFLFRVFPTLVRSLEFDTTYIHKATRQQRSFTLQWTSIISSVPLHAG